MSLLLDTHVVLWWLSDDPTLAAEIKARLDHEPDTFISPATIWEVTIKQAIGKLKEPADLPERIRDSGFRELPITSGHAITAGLLRRSITIPSTGCSWLRRNAKISPWSPGILRCTSTRSPC